MEYKLYNCGEQNVTGRFRALKSLQRLIKKHVFV